MGQKVQINNFISLINFFLIFFKKKANSNKIYYNQLVNMFVNHVAGYKGTKTKLGLNKDLKE